MTEIHIFDFDGTLFYSPAPTQSAAASLIPPVALANTAAAATEAAPNIAVGNDCHSPAGNELETTEKLYETEADKLYGSLLNPVDSGGYGWFQSIHTMSPPFVPEAPKADVWFVKPILSHMRALVERRNAQLRDLKAKKKDTPLLYVLTGRDVKYYDRIWTLLQQVGLDKEVEDVILKPHETAGTVTYKLNRLFSIIQRHHPSRVFYYEDRVEQGGRLLEGIRVLEEVLYYNTRGCGSGTGNDSGDNDMTAADRVGVVTFDVKATSTAAAENNNLIGSVNSALYTPQPEVIFQFGAHADVGQLSPAETDPRHTFLTSTLRASPYPLLRDACYPLDRIGTFYQNETDISDENAKKAAERAERQAQRWVEGTIEFWNAKNTPEKRDRVGSNTRGVTPAKKAAATANAKFDAKALSNSIHFKVAPSFAFIMVLVPAAIRDRSNYMLDAGQFAALVGLLKAAREKRIMQSPAV